MMNESERRELRRAMNWLKKIIENHTNYIRNLEKRVSMLEERVFKKELKAARDLEGYDATKTS